MRKTLASHMDSPRFGKRRGNLNGKKKAGLEAEFKHNTSISADGMIFYDAPIQIRDQQDLDNYNIS